MAVRIHLLARNVTATPGFTDTKTYRLGTNADGSDNSVTPGGAFKRHAFTGLVRVVNLEPAPRADLWRRVMPTHEEMPR